MIWLLVGVMLLLLAGLVAIVIAITKKQKEAKVKQSAKIHTTQEQLPFVYIRRGVVKLKNGQYIKLMQVPSINTQLMEEEEKEIVRETYMGLLNSLDFKIQFYKQSRLVDINDYLAFLKDKENTSDNDFKTKGLQYYSRFIRELVKENSVQTKKDFLVVAFREDNANTKKLTKDSMKKYRKGEEDSQLFEEEEAIREEKTFEKAYKTLTQREKTLQKQLRRFGMNATFLDDKQAFELFYIAYNKERAVYQSLKDVNPNNFTTLYVKHENEGGE
ncbi:hypothetical protein [Priestia aryabhattai]